MELPIDVSDGPFREKYLDEETPMLSRWFVFGWHKDGLVDVANREGDVLINCTRDQAAQLVEERNTFVNSVLRIVNRRVG